MTTECDVCGGSGWVCEDHTDKPWDGASYREDACHCGGAGLPCLACNPCDDVTEPEVAGGLHFLSGSGRLEELKQPELKDMTTWTEHLGHSSLRSFTDAEGHFWLEQNQAKPSKWGKFASKGHQLAWEFAGPGGAYTGRMLIDGEIYTASEATKKFLQE